MKIFYSDAPLVLDPNSHSIFLAGPTPRALNVKSWRPIAVQILENLGYQGQVIIPEHSTSKAGFDYDTQVEWENTGTEGCSKLIVWIPRDLDVLPGYTTNVEFGRYVRSGKMLYGRPPGAPKTAYLDWLYRKFNEQPVYTELEQLLQAATDEFK